jgi:hypothetical protein
MKDEIREQANINMLKELKEIRTQAVLGVIPC